MVHLKSLVFLSIVLLLALGALHCDDPEVGDDDDSFVDEDDDNDLNDDVDDDIDDEIDDDLNDDIDDDLNDDADDDDIWDDDVDDDVDDDADVLEPLCPALPWSDDTVELPIRLQNGPELSAFGFSVSFPNSAISYSAVHNEALLPPNKIRCQAEVARHVVCVVDPLPAPLAAGTNGLIARIEFTVNDSPATASFQLYDLSGDLTEYPNSQCDSQ